MGTPVIARHAFDAVLLISFGGPQGMEDIRPFLANVLRGRNVPQARIDEVAHHYELFGGVSPITELTQRQARGLERALAEAGTPLPVFIGMRNWHPFLVDTLTEMSRAGVKRALGLILAAQASYSSCQQYRENVRDARVRLPDAGVPDVEVIFARGWHTDAGFIEANAAHVEAARARLPEPLRAEARLICTAHSIPTSMAERSRYVEQLLDSSRAVAQRTGISDWALVFQSRSGRPQDPWLEPDVGDYLRASHEEGLRAAVLCPIGFVSDHIEVLYDLDREAADIAAGLGIALARASAVNDHPRFIDTLRDVVRFALDRYAGGRPLPLAAPS